MLKINKYRAEMPEIAEPIYQKYLPKVRLSPDEPATGLLKTAQIRFRGTVPMLGFYVPETIIPPNTLIALTPQQVEWKYGTLEQTQLTSVIPPTNNTLLPSSPRRSRFHVTKKPARFNLFSTPE
jgi:hypothetical protein